MSLDKTKLNILVVDDMNMGRMLVINALTQNGYTQHQQANNGKVALDLLLSSSTKFDLILSDWTMPEMNGLTFFKELKANDKLNNIPFIMITAETEKSQVAMALEAGVNAYITKPFTALNLDEKIQSVLKL
jgi:two-component system chemotaxis response regulator CheY